MLGDMVTIVNPPTPQRLSPLRPLLRVAAHLTFAGSVATTVTASVLMLTSIGLGKLAEMHLLVGDRLRQTGLLLLSLGHPVAAAVYRARDGWQMRREQGIDLD